MNFFSKTSPSTIVGNQLNYTFDGDYDRLLCGDIVVARDELTRSRSLSSFIGVKESGYGRVKVEVVFREGIVLVKVPTGQHAVVPRNSLCDLFRKYNFEADNVSC